MALFLASAYIFICVFSFVLIKLIIDYVKSKPSYRYSLSDLVFLDLGRWTIINVIFISSLFLLRDIFGPFRSTTQGDFALFLTQTLFFCFMACCICFHLIQVSYVCEFRTVLNNDERVIVIIQRFVTLVAGFSSSSVVCFFQGGVCHDGPFPVYFKQDYLHLDDIPFNPVFVISILAHLVVMLVCQTVLEVKRLELKFFEQEASRLAKTASQNIEAAKTKFQLNKIRNPEVRQVWIDLSSGKDPPPPPFRRKNLADSRQIGLAMSRLLIKSFLFFAAILVLIVFIQKVDSNRPHGSVLITLTVWGICLPVTIILHNPPIMNFVLHRWSKLEAKVNLRN